MNRLVTLALIATMVVLAAQGMAEEAAPAVPVLPTITPTAVEDWFFNFLGKLLDLLANFIGQILQQIFGGINGMFAGEPNIHSV